MCTEKTEIYRDNERYVGIHIVRIYTNTRSLHVCHDVHNVHITYIYILYIIIIIIVIVCTNVCVRGCVRVFSAVHRHITYHIRTLCQKVQSAPTAARRHTVIIFSQSTYDR